MVEITTLSTQNMTTVQHTGQKKAAKSGTTLKKTKSSWLRIQVAELPLKHFYKKKFVKSLQGVLSTELYCDSGSTEVRTETD